MSRRFSPTADRTFLYGSELLTLDAATVMGRRTSRRIGRQIPRGATVSMEHQIKRLRKFIRKVTGAAVAVAISGGRW